MALTGVPRAQAGYVSRLNEAILNTPYFHVSSTFAGQDSSDRERWILRDERQFIEVDGRERTLYDLSSGNQILIRPGEPDAVQKPIDPVRRQLLEGQFNTLLGILTFERLDAIPADARCEEVEKGVYDCKWSSPGKDGTVTHLKCVVFRSAGGDLPDRLEIYLKTPGQDIYAPMETITINRTDEAAVGRELDKFPPKGS